MLNQHFSQHLVTSSSISWPMDKLMIETTSKEIMNQFSEEKYCWYERNTSLFRFWSTLIKSKHRLYLLYGLKLLIQQKTTLLIAYLFFNCFCYWFLTRINTSFNIRWKNHCSTLKIAETLLLESWWFPSLSLPTPV